MRQRGSHDLPRSLLHCLGHTGERLSLRPVRAHYPKNPHPRTHAPPSPQPLPVPTQRLHRRPEPRIHSCERQAGHLGLNPARPEARTGGPHCGAARLGSSKHTPHLSRVHEAPTSHAQQRHDSRRPERGGRSAGLRAYAGARPPAMSLQHRGRGQRLTRSDAAAWAEPETRDGAGPGWRLKGLVSRGESRPGRFCSKAFCSLYQPRWVFLSVLRLPRSPRFYFPL